MIGRFTFVFLFVLIALPTPLGAQPSVSGSVTVKDETVVKGRIRAVDFTGSSVAATVSGDTATVTLTGTFTTPVSTALGTITADSQAFNSTATWNNGAVVFTHWKMTVTDTASSSASLLIDANVVGSGSLFSVRKDGLVRAVGGLISSGVIQFPNSQGLVSQTNGRITFADGDGIVTLYNNAQNGFGRVNFGGPTSSFPAWKRSTVNFQARLGDDSAYTDVEVADEVYGAGWNGSQEVPTKNAVYDKIEAVAAPQSITFTATLFANLGTPSNGTLVYCSDCTFANPCASGGTGAFAKRLNGAWRCD